jgi:hypothetical protein
MELYRTQVNDYRASDAAVRQFFVEFDEAIEFMDNLADDGKITGVKRLDDFSEELD